MDRYTALIEYWNSISRAEKENVCAEFFRANRGGGSSHLPRINACIASQVRYRQKYFESLSVEARGTLLARYFRSISYAAMVEVLQYGLTILVPQLLTYFGERVSDRVKTVVSLAYDSNPPDHAITALINELTAARKDPGLHHEVDVLLRFVRATALQSNLVDEFAYVDGSRDRKDVADSGQSSYSDSVVAKPRNRQTATVSESIHPVDDDSTTNEHVSCPPAHMELAELYRRQALTGIDIGTHGNALSPPLALSAAQHDAFDRMVIREVTRAQVEHTNGERVAELDDVLRALVTYQYQRPRIFFHLGFADATVTGRVVAWTNPLMNPERRAWYLLGAFTGLFQRGEHDAAAKLLDEKMDVFRLAAGQPGTPTSVSTAWMLYGGEKLYQLGRLLELQQLIASDAIDWQIAGVISNNLVRRVLEDAERDLRAGDAVMAKSRLASIGDSPFIDVESDLYDDTTAFDYLYIEGLMLLAAGNYDAAEENLEGLLKATDERSVQALPKWYLTRSLCRLRLTTLWALAVPEGIEAKTRLWTRLEKCKADFERCLESDDESASASVGLALRSYLAWTLGKERDGSDSESAKRCARRALQKVPTVRGINENLRQETRSWLSMIMAVLLADSLDAAIDEQVPKYLEEVYLLGRRLPSDDLRKLIDGLSLTSPDMSAAVVVQLERSGLDMKQYLHDVELLSRSSSLSEIAATRACDVFVAPAAAWDSWYALFRAYEKTNNNHRAADALDALYGIAMNGDCVEETLRVFTRRGEAERVLGVRTTLSLQTNLLLTINRRDDAVSGVHELFHLIRGNSQEEARAFLDDLQEYGFGWEDLAPLFQSLPPSDELAVSPNPEVESEKGFAVLFVGGDERQARHQQKILASVRVRFPNVTLHFIHPGWQTGYMSHYERAMQIARECSAIVLMPLVRTNLGRLLRRDTPVPWFPCNARGPEGITRALLVAARHCAR